MVSAMGTPEGKGIGNFILFDQDLKARHVAGCQLDPGNRAWLDEASGANMHVTLSDTDNCLPACSCLSVSMLYYS